MKLLNLQSALCGLLLAACATFTADPPPERASDDSRGGTGPASGGGQGGASSTGGSKALPHPAGSAGSGAAGGGGKASNGGAPGGVSAGGGAAGAGMTSGGTPSGGSGAGSVCGAPPVAPGTTPLIDDFEHLGRAVPANEGRSGVWDVWTKTASAAMFPPSANYQTTGADMGAGYTHWTGTNIGGPDDWGPTLTVQLAGGCPYDASVYSGISLRLKGSAVKQSGATTAPLPLKVMLWQPPGVPAQDAKGGTCTAVACYNHFSTFVAVPAAWDAPVVVPFASLTQGVWPGTMPFAWNPKQLIAIQFQVEVNGSNTELATFDLSIDDLAFVP